MSALPPKAEHSLSLVRCPLSAKSGHLCHLLDHFVGDSEPLVVHVHCPLGTFAVGVARYQSQVV
jgi:hypothetical protein